MLTLLKKILGLDAFLEEDALREAEAKAEILAEAEAQPVIVPKLVKSTHSKKPQHLEMTRADMLQKMWGAGFNGPGDANFVRDLAKPLGLDSQKSVLDLSAGLGGGTRALADAFKTYVTGFERDKELAVEGNKISKATGHGRSAPIQHYDPFNFSYEKRADAVIARGIAYTCADKDAFLVRVSATLKPRGHLVITDITCEQDHLMHPDVQAWIKMERHEAHPVSNLEFSEILTRHKFDVRVNANISQDYRHMVLVGLAKLANYLQDRKLSPQLRDMVKAETEYWERRLKAMEAGVNYTRFYAIKTN